VDLVLTFVAMLGDGEHLPKRVGERLRARLLAHDPQ
jgi:hypothetical protein